MMGHATRIILCGREFKARKDERCLALPSRCYAPTRAHFYFFFATLLPIRPLGNFGAALLTFFAAMLAFTSFLGDIP